MMITLSMWLHSIVSNEVSAASQTKILILVAKKNTLKATKTYVFRAHFIMNPDSPVTSLMQRHYSKKSLKESEIAVLSDLNKSDLKNLSTWH